MNLDDQAWPAMTFRDALHKAFNDDWNSRRMVSGSPREEDRFITRIVIEIECPMTDAVEAYQQLMEKEKSNETTRR